MTHSLVKKSKFTPQEWVHKIKFSAAAAAVIATGQSLEKAKDDLGPGNFVIMFKEHPNHVDDPLLFSIRTAQRLMEIGRHALLSEATHVSRLPASWGTLYELTRVPNKYLLRGFDNGMIRPDMQRKDVKLLLPEKKKITPPLPEGKFRVIYADPPWAYDNSGFDQSAASQYETMDTDEIIENVKAADKADEHCALFLWVTSPILPDGLRVMEAWGFEYKASIIWDKEKAPGMGWWVNTKHEFLLIGSKGDIGVPKEKPDSVFRYPVGKHSEKPPIIRSMIELMFPGPYIELFARQRVAGWEAWGNEIQKQAS